MIIVEQASHEIILQELAAAYGGYLKFRFRSQYGNFYELKLGLQPEEHRTDWFSSPPARFHWIMQINTYTYTHTRGLIRRHHLPRNPPLAKQMFEVPVGG